MQINAAYTFGQWFDYYSGGTVNELVTTPGDQFNWRTNYGRIINHSDAEFLFVDTKKQLEKISQIRENLPKIKEVICLESSDVATSCEDFINYGRENRAEFLPRVEEIGFNAKPEDIAIMVYTLGTTGKPKGAMLSHQYILNSCESLRQTIPIYDTDVSFSYLPGCHVAERVAGIYNRLCNRRSRRRWISIKRF